MTSIRVLLFSSIVFSCLGFQALAAPFCPEAQRSAVLHQPATRADALKHYLFLNLAFPQHSETIWSGMSAFFLTHDLPLEQIARGFSEQELDQAFTAMSRAHQAHGIERQVQKQELARVTMPFFTWFPDVIRGITKFVIHPEQLPKPSYFTKDQTLEILHAPEHAARLEQVRGYARTVAKVLRSTEAREISNRLRQTLARNPDLPSDQRLDSRAAGDAIQDLVVRKLIAVHPELGQYVVNFGGSTFFPAQPLALFFFQSISHPDTH